MPRRRLVAGPSGSRYKVQRRAAPSASPLTIAEPRRLAPLRVIPRLEIVGLSKAFPGVRALDRVDLTIAPGEVLALVGENGAGKSTLIRTLAGIHPPDAGTLRLDGAALRFRQPREAARAGIAVMHQELNLIPALSVRENLFLGQERARGGWVLRAEERRLAAEVFRRLGVELPLEAPVGRLTVAQQQLVEIAKALLLDARLVVLDEPTATLTPPEVERLLGIVRELRTRGLGILYVSHRLDEVFALADRVAVLRDGQLVGAYPIAEVTRGTLIERMVGRPLADEFPPRTVERGGPRLVVEGLCRGRAVRDVSFSIRRGEVLGLAGLVGAGRTEVARLLFGADRRDAGRITLDGQPLALRSPREALRAGIVLLPEDRKAQGLVLEHSVRENFALPHLAEWATAGWLSLRQERQALDAQARAVALKAASVERPVRLLSGGNQQKVVLARWLAGRAEVFLFDEPTRGVDVGAKYEIYQLINGLAVAGKAILLVSSELPELLGMADRILVMHEGRVTAEIGDVGRATQADILQWAVA